MNIRIHGTRLNGSQSAALRREAREVADHATFSPHALTRMKQTNIIGGAVRRCVDTGCIIELHLVNGDRRLIMRDGHGVIVTLSLDGRIFVTVFRNAPADAHVTMNVGEYYWGAIEERWLARKE